VNKTAEPDTIPARRGRWGRRLVLGLVVLVGLVAIAPLGLGPVLRAVVVNALEDELDAHARVQAVSFAWPARLSVRGLELSDASGAPLAALDELRADFELGPLLLGKFHGEIELDYPELHLARAGDGRWNWERVLRESQPRPEEERDEADAAEAVPEVRVRLRIADGHVLVHGPRGDTVLGDIALAIDIDGLEHPAPFRLSLGAHGPLGPAGGLALEGSFTAAAGGRLDVLGFEGDAKLALEQLDLAGFAPALALVASVSGLGGVVNGKAEVSLGAGLALAGKSEIEVRDLALRGPRAGAELTRIAYIQLHGEATQHGQGDGDQHLELSADSFLTLAYDGRSSAPARGAGTIAGTLGMTADLAQVSELARGWVPLQPGVALAGRIEARAELGVTLADRRPASASAKLRAGIEGLAARDAAGRALDLSQLAGLALELDAAADLEHGTLAVPAFAVRSGPVTCTGRLEAAGLAAADAPEGFELRSGAFELEADLEELRGTLAQVVELEGVPFGGHLNASGTLSGEDGSPDHLEARLEGRGLTFAGTSLADLRCQATARRGTDRALSGSAEATFGRIGLALEDGSALELPGARLELTLSEDAVGRGAHTLGLVTSDSALSLELKGTNERGDGELALATTLAMRGRVANLAALAASFAPVQPGLDGSLRAEGELSARLAGGTLASAGGKLQLQLADLTALDAGGKPRRLGALEQASLALAGELDARAGRAELSSLQLSTGGLELSGSGRVLGIADKPEIEEGKLTLAADLARLGPEIAHVLDLGGWTIAGSPLAAEARLSTKDQLIEAAGSLEVASVLLERAGHPLALRDVGVAFDLGYDTVLGSLHVRSASARSGTTELRLAGTLNELRAPARARGAMQLELEGELARLLGDLGLETEASGRKTTGSLAVKLALEGDGGAFRVTGKSTIDDFRLELAPTAPGEAPIVIEEPRITLDCAAGVTLANLDVELSRLTLESGHTRGGAEGRIENLRALARAEDAGEVRFVGLKGQLAYIPDRLGAVLAPLLPGKLSGAEEQRLNFTLDGHARDLDLATLLAGSQARVDLGIGRFERPEGQIDGALVMETKDEKLLVRGDLGANGGTMQIDGQLDLAQGAEKPRSKLAVTAKAVRANAKLAPLLGKLHPAFGAAQLAQGSLDGLIGLSLDLAYDAPLPLDAFEAGWAALPKEPIHGTGRLEIASAALRGSPFLALLSGLGVDVEKTLDLRPIDFTIEKGRVTYAKPWIWSFAGTETTFTGSLGLDESLDLVWNVPITAKLVERWSFLAALEDERLAIPLSGTVRSPRLEADELLTALAAKAAKRELESRLGLGGKASGDDPATLLERADTLWSQGQRTEAAALYSRLREDFKLSLAYALNKDRIKERSKYKEPPK